MGEITEQVIISINDKGEFLQWVWICVCDDNIENYIYILLTANKYIWLVIFYFCFLQTVIISMSTR